MRRSWQKALATFLVVCIWVTSVGEPLGRSYAADVPGMAEPASIENGQAPVLETGSDLAQRSNSSGLTSAEAQLPQEQPTPPASPDPELPLPVAEEYVPSGIPIEDLPLQHPLVNLNLRLPAQDPDAAGQHIAQTLRGHRRARELAPEVASLPSAEIVALAAGLDNDPQIIYEYVHNHYDFVPTWGLLKSPVETYLAKAGNGFDQAALLVALLQAAGYGAEFAFGEIEIPLEQAMNWVGVTSSQVLPEVFRNGGIPAEVRGNVLHLAHIWVRVRIDGQWHPLDPSFKAYAYDPGLDLAVVMGYNRSAFLSAGESGSTITADYVRRISESGINSQLTQYSNNLIDHLRASNPFAYLEEVIGGREIVPEVLDGYPTELPYTVVSSWGEAAEVPEEYVYKLHIEVPGIDYRANFPDIAGERITIFYVGATPGDQATIDAAGDIYRVYPAYQVNMVPELRIGGQLMATGEARSLGSWEPINVCVHTPILDQQGNPWTVCYAPQWLRVGAWYALPMMLQTVSPEALRRQHRELTEELAAGLPEDSEPVLGQMLYSIGLSYFNQADASDRLDAQLADVVCIPHVRGMLISQSVSVAEWAQIGGEWRPMRLGLAACSIDVRLNWYSIVSASGDADRERGFMTDAGHKSSAIEHATIEQLQNNPSVSTIQVLDIANNEGLRIYHITPSTVEAILPLLDYSTSIKDSLRADVQAGYEVTVPERNITYNQWTGTGWISFHPQSGSAGYWLSGSIGDLPVDNGMPAIRMGGNGSQASQPDPYAGKRNFDDGTKTGTDCTGCNRADGPSASGTDPVDTATGSFLQSSTDLFFGVLGYPIRFSRTYVSDRNLEEGPLGFGWSHNYGMSLVESSDWARGFGFRSATDGAASIAEAYVGVDIAATAAGALPHQVVVIGSECADWATAEVTANVVTVTGPNGFKRQYLELTDGTYYPSRSLARALIRNGDGTFREEDKDGSRLDFDAQGRGTSLTDPNGNRTTLSYDAAGNLIRVTDAVGRSIELAYGGAHVTTITDPADRVFRYEYDGAGNLIRYTDAAGGITSYTYDGAHRLTSITDPEGITFVTNVYDEWGRVVRQTNGAGHTMVMRYGDVRSTIIDAMANQTRLFYDRYRRLIGTLDPLGYTTSNRYDATDNIVSRTAENGNTVTFTYDSRDNLIRIASPLGGTVEHSYDGRDNLASATDPQGRTSSFAYDDRNNLIRMTDALGYVTELSYDSRGQLVRSTDANGNAFTGSYDSHGNLVQVADALGHVLVTSFDLLGRPTSATNPNGHSTGFSYDDNGGLVSITNALGHTTTYSRDRNGLLTSMTDARGNMTRFTYDATLNLSSVADALDQVTRYAYDANENLTEVTDALGHVTVYERDPIGRTTRIIDPLGRATSFTYDGNGNLIAKIKPDGHTISYQYDANDRVTSVSYPDGSAVSYEYDAGDSLVGATYGSWSARYEYDGAGRLARKELPNDNLAIAYAYDPAGRLQSTEARRGSTLLHSMQYEYDAADRLVRLLDTASGQSIGYTWDAGTNVTAITYPSGAGTTYDYDAADRVIGARNVDAAGGTMSSWAYVYDEVDNPVQVARDAPGTSLVTSYTYDALDRLVRESYPSYDIGYAYDAVGNRTRMVSPMGTVNYAYDAADQLLSSGPVTFAYDANGNQTNRTDARGTFVYEYDDENRLSAITSPGGIVTSFRYDPAGRRVWTHGPMGETRFVYDGYVLMLEESVQSGQGTAYLYGNGALALARPLNAAHAAAELAYHDDGRGNVVNLSDVAGLPRGAIGYDAFGRANAPAGLEQQAVSFLGKFGVRAEESMTDLYLMGFRYYDASTGRFLSRDPWPGNVSRPLSLNSYAYALNNPLRYADPSGLKPCDARLKVDPFSPDTQLTHLGPALTDEELVEAIKSAYDAVLQVNAEKGRMQVKTPHDDAIAKAEAEDRKQGNALRIRRPVDPLTSAQLDTLAAHWMWVAGSLNADLVSRGGRRIMPPWKVPYPVKGPARPPDSPPALHPRARVLSNFLRWGGKPGFIHVGMRLDNVMNDPQQGGP